MGIMTRMLRLFKADVHGVMDQLEDKELVLKQHLREMEQSLHQKENQLADLACACRKIDGDLARHLEAVSRIETDLDLALSGQKDDITRVLIRKRRTIQLLCDHLQRRKNILNESRQQLAETLDRQRLQYEELKARVAVFCNRPDDRPFDNGASQMIWAAGIHAPSEEEIELELLQRKEMLKKGGTP
jgi:phage shock protein A